MSFTLINRDPWTELAKLMNFPSWTKSKSCDNSSLFKETLCLKLSHYIKKRTIYQAFQGFQTAETLVMLLVFVDTLLVFVLLQPQLLQSSLTKTTKSSQFCH